jgi:hypothetical protein
MPEESFNTVNQIGSNETRAGRFLRQTMLRRLVARDVELMDLMERGGPPSNTPAPSVIQRDVNPVYTSATAIGGIVYCDTFTVNPGVVVTVDRFLIVKASQEVIIHGHINATGVGGYGGISDVIGQPGGPGNNGITPGGGGGKSDESYSGGKGGNGVLMLSGGAGGGTIESPSGSGVNATQHTQITKAYITANPYSMLMGGAGGGGGGCSNDTYGYGNGGRGGGVIILDAPLITLSANAIISAAGGNGEYGGSSSGAPGGGGGGLIYIRTRNYSASDSAVFNVSGGSPGGTDGGGSPGGAGADGVVQIDVFG